MGVGPSVPASGSRRADGVGVAAAPLVPVSEPEQAMVARRQLAMARSDRQLVAAGRIVLGTSATSRRLPVPRDHSPVVRASAAVVCRVRNGAIRTRRGGPSHVRGHYGQWCRSVIWNVDDDWRPRDDRDRSVRRRGGNRSRACCQGGRDG